MTSDNGYTLFVCQGTGCVSSRSAEVRQALEIEVEKQKLGEKVKVEFSGCHGFCEQGPLVAIEPEGILYVHVSEKDAEEIIKEHLGGGKPVERLLYRDPVSGKSIPLYRDIPFYSKQTRRILKNCGLINPEKIEDYFAVGGYQALQKVFKELSPQQVIDEVTRAGLRGRGGAGFPTGRKWLSARQAQATQKYIICNADEGDPGAYMDRSILEADPHSVIEGMIIGAYATGASSGYVYVRAEYPLAVQRVKKAIIEAEKHKLLGKNILGSGFDFSLDVECGSGAFVAGELSAMITSIEGSTAEPRQRPPGTTVKGLWGKPTVTNNVKTWANVPLIISRGAGWFAGIGTEKSKGTAVFSLVGKIRNTGLVEVPMGTTLRSLIFDIGGGIPDGKKFKAVQTGGPSGGCIPEPLLDLPVDYEKLAEAGSIMGSGGMVVMDEDTCMVDVAKFFLAFTKDESCGKCVPCREGCSLMHELLTDITEGRGQKGDIELLEEMGKRISDTALCGLGESAPNPVLTTIRYFREEYEAHINEKRCPARVCKALTSYYIEPSKCQACMICMRNCPVQAISGDKGQIHVIDQEKCTKCGTCFSMCPARFSAVTRLSGVPVPSPLPAEKRILIRAK
jgi:NADH-quinone oxidoreductase subunit F